jgi:hypothetical protein
MHTVFAHGSEFRIGMECCGGQLVFNGFAHVANNRWTGWSASHEITFPNHLFATYEKVIQYRNIY